MDDPARPSSSDPNGTSPIPEGGLSFGDFRFDWHTEILTGPEGEVRLRRQTLLLLKALLRAHPRILSRDELLDQVWGVDHVSTSSVKQTISELRSALSDSATDPRYIQTLHRQGYRFIAKVEQISTEEIQDSPVQPIPETLRPASKGPYLLLAALLTLGIGLAAFWGDRPDAPSTLSDGPAFSEDVGAITQRLAILKFRSMAPDREHWIGPALREMTSVELLTFDRLSVIPVSQSERIEGYSGTGRLTLAQTQEVSSALAADLIASGSYLIDANDQLMVQMVVQQPDAEVVLAISESTEVNALGRLVEHIAERLAKELPQDGSLAAPSHDATQFFSQNPEVIRLYSEGMERLRRRELSAARQSLSRALELDPKNPWPRAALSDAWLQLGFREQAIQEAAQAVELSRHLSPVVQLTFEAQLQQARQDWQQAVPLLRRLWKLKTGDLEIGLQLAACERQVPNPGAANEVLLLLEALNPHAAGDARLSQERAAIAKFQGDYEGALVSLVKAETLALARGDRAVFAAIKTHQSHLYKRMGDLQSALDAAVESERIHRELGDAFAVAQALRMRGASHQALGKLDAAENDYLEAQTTFERLETRREQARVLNDLAALAAVRGELGATIPLLQQSLELKKEVKDWNGVVLALSNTALIKLNLGRLEAARRDLNEMQELNRPLGNVGIAARGHWYLGQVELREGKWAEAEASFVEASKLLEQNGESVAAFTAGCELLEILIGSGNLERADQHFESLSSQIETTAYQLAQDICLNQGGWLALYLGDLDTAESRFQKIIDSNGGYNTSAGLSALEGLIQAALMAGDIDSAQTRLDTFLREAEDLGSEPLEAMGRTAQIELLLARGAGNEAVTLNPLSETGAPKPSNAYLGILLARARLLTGDCRQARAALQAVAAPLDRVSYGTRLEWRRVEALQMMSCGRPREARELLTGAILDAQQHGFRFLELRLRGMGLELLDDQNRSEARSQWLQELETTGLFGAQIPPR